MVDKNHAVLFDYGGSYALNKKTGKMTPFERKARGWDLKLQLDAPNHANQVMKQMLAELKEFKVQEFSPAIRFTTVGDGEDGGLRVDPLFRLAVAIQ